MYETGEEAARREVREETGLEITSCRYLFSIPNLYMYSGFQVHTLDMFYLCDVPDFSHACAADDAAAIVVSPLDALDPASFGLDSIRRAVDRVIREGLS